MIALGSAIGVVVFLLVETIVAQLSSPASASPASAPAPRIAAPGHSYDSCADARAAGDAPLVGGDPGYGPHLDADRDGIACEPYP